MDIRDEGSHSWKYLEFDQTGREESRSYGMPSFSDIVAGARVFVRFRLGPCGKIVVRSVERFRGTTATAQSKIISVITVLINETD